MKRKLSLALACTMALSLFSFAPATMAEEASPEMDSLIEAAKEEGELTVYGSCEEEYLSAACQKFESMYDIKVSYQRLSTSEVYTKISEEAGNPSGDVWFGGTTDPYNEAVADGLLEPYEAINAANLISDDYKDPTNCWYGIYKGILGFMVNTEELNRLGLEAPKTWDDLTKEEYKGLIMLSNPNTAGTAKLIINTMVQMKGHDEAMEYFKKLDQNVSQYTKSGSWPLQDGRPRRVCDRCWFPARRHLPDPAGLRQHSAGRSRGRHFLRDRRYRNLQRMCSSQRCQAVD